MNAPFACIDPPEPEVAEQLPGLIEQADDALAGATQKAIGRIVGMITTVFPAARVSQAEATMRVELYTTGLGDLPEDALQSGMIEGIKVWRFFPTIAEIREQAEPYLLERRKLLRTLQAMAMKAPQARDQAEMERLRGVANQFSAEAH